jgi:ADP-heptose:LPS heptosyltransferase
MKHCRYFKGDRPCKYYWVDRSWDCNSCEHYNPYSNRILLIKLDAIGDVLRSTPMAEGIKKKYPNSELLWITKSECRMFIENNNYIDKVLTYNEETVRILQAQKFDIIINLDKDAKATSLISSLSASEKLGYTISEDGCVVPLNQEAEYQYTICMDNWGAKRVNTKTYIEMLFDISKLVYENERPSLFLNTSKQLEFKNQFYKENSIEKDARIIILNTGCGPVYPHKKWTYEGYRDLIKLLVLDKKNKIILTGSEGERDRNANLIKDVSSDQIINTTEKYDIENFCYLIDICHIMVTGDTMALHAAIALNKKIIAFFGPGPFAETDLFDLGTKMYRSELDCLMCHDQFECPYNGKCMSLISHLDVYNKIKKLY